MNKKNIAENHGVNLNNYIPKNVVVTQINPVNVFYFSFLFIVALFFIIMAMFNKSILVLFIFGISLGSILLIISIWLFINMLLFKIRFLDGQIVYRHFFKSFNFHASHIEYFKVETDTYMRYYRVEIVCDGDKKIKYTIAQTNKENFIFLLNLLKMGVKQK